MIITCSASPNMIRLHQIPRQINVEGKIFDSKGQPAEKINIIVSATWGEKAAGTSNSKGNWVITLKNLPRKPGNYTIHVEAENYGSCQTIIRVVK